MKKTISVNIKGINFLIEEDAYELLEKYINRLKIVLKNEDGSFEIIEDVELRIAELCTSKLRETKTVIELADIESIISTLGNPEDFVDTDGEDTRDFRDESNSTGQKPEERRLFRDRDGATIAGVCSGVASYFNIDVVIIRAIFVVMFLFAGFGIPLYIILWVIIPPANNTIDRLRMKGKPITVETVKEEVEKAAENIKKGSRKIVDKIHNEDNYKRRISRGGKILSSLLGIGFMGFGVVILIPFIIFIIGGFQIIPIQGDQGLYSLAEFGNLVLSNDSDYSIFWTGSMLAGFSAILFLLLLGIILIFKIRNKWSKLSLFGLFLTGVVGVIMCSVIGVRTGRDFFIGAEIEKTIATINSPELIILPKLEKIDSLENYSVKSNGRLNLLEVDDSYITLYGVNIEYKNSPDSLYHITKNLTTRSQSHKIGLKKCQNIEHLVTVKNDTIYIAPQYRFPIEDKLRNQEVTIIIEIPENKKVKVNHLEIGLKKKEYEDGTSTIIKEEGYLFENGRYEHD